MSPEAAAAELRRMAASADADGDAVECVLAAAGHRTRRRPAALPAGLTTREAEVLALAAAGLTTAQIAERLVISPKTADSHIQHIYAKIGCSTRLRFRSRTRLASPTTSPRRGPQRLADPVRFFQRKSRGATADRRRAWPGSVLT
jgi:DNA-binding CsgD family transcriptional regulator